MDGNRPVASLAIGLGKQTPPKTIPRISHMNLVIPAKMDDGREVSSIGIVARSRRLHVELDGQIM